MSQTPPSSAPSPGADAGRLPWRAVALLAGVGLVALLAWLGDAGSYLRELRGWIASLGMWAPLAFVVLYAAATVAALPGVALSAVAGGLFGSFWGVVVVSLGSTLGAGLAFLVARHLARESVEDWLQGNPRFQRLDRLARRHGPVVVAIARLVPLFPYNLLNFGFGLTPIPFGIYLFYSWLCMLPGTILYVVGFDALFTGLAQGRVPWVLVAVAVGAAVLLALLVSRLRRRLQDEPPGNEAE